MAFSIRPATVDDLMATQRLNLKCLPENYQSKYYFYKRLSWPQLQFVAEDAFREPVGYTLGKIEADEDNDDAAVSGHTTSLGVLRTHRQAGLAKDLMRVSQKIMIDCYHAHTSSLHVRVTNTPAFNLYCDVIGYNIQSSAKSYYENAEDAFSMAIDLSQPKKPAVVHPKSKKSVGARKKRGSKGK